MRILALRPRPLRPGRHRRTGFLSSMRGQGHPPHLLVQRAFPAGMPGLCHRLLTGTPIHTRGKSPSHQVGAGGSRSPWKRKHPEGLRWAARAGWGWTPGSPPEQDALAPSSAPCPDTGLGHKGRPCPQRLARLTTCDQVPKMPVSSEGPVPEPPEYTQVGLPFTPKYPRGGCHRAARRHAASQQCCPHPARDREEGGALVGGAGGWTGTVQMPGEAMGPVGLVRLCHPAAVVPRLQGSRAEMILNPASSPLGLTPNPQRPPRRGVDNWGEVGVGAGPVPLPPPSLFPDKPA